MQVLYTFWSVKRGLELCVSFGKLQKFLGLLKSLIFLFSINFECFVIAFEQSENAYYS